MKKLSENQKLRNINCRDLDFLKTGNATQTNLNLVHTITDWRTELCTDCSLYQFFLCVSELLQCWTGNNWTLYSQFIRNPQFVLERIVSIKKYSDYSTVESKLMTTARNQLNTLKLIVQVCNFYQMQKDLEMTLYYAILMPVQPRLHFTADIKHRQRSTVLMQLSL